MVCPKLVMTQPLERRWGINKDRVCGRGSIEGWSSVGAWADARQVRGGDGGVAGRAVEGRDLAGTLATEISV